MRFDALVLLEKDIPRLATFLKIKPATFLRKYCEGESALELFTQAIEGVKKQRQLYMRLKPACPFLTRKRRCKVYTVRPQACRDFKPGNIMCKYLRKDYGCDE